MESSEFVEKTGLEDKIGFEDNIVFVDSVGSVEDYAEPVFERVEDDDDDDCASEVASVRAHTSSAA